MVIEVDDMDSVPRVMYKGKSLEGRHHINYEWLTKTEHVKQGVHNFTLDFYDKNDRTVIKNIRGCEKQETITAKEMQETLRKKSAVPPLK